MIVEDRVAAYNVPSGILFDMHRDAAARRPGVLTQVGLDTFVDPAREGCAMNAARRAPGRSSPGSTFAGETWLHFPNIPPDVAILRATTADERGNLTYEHEGAYLGGLEQAIAARCNGGLVIAQVKRVTARGLAASARRPRARPSRRPDRGRSGPDADDRNPLRSGHLRRDPATLVDSFSLAERGRREGRRPPRRDGAARRPTSPTSASASRRWCRASCSRTGATRAVTWAIEQGAVGGMPLTGFAFGCASNADAFVPSPQQFTYFQGGGFDLSLPLLPRDRRRRQRQRLQARQEALPDRRLRRLRRHHRQRAQDRVRGPVRGRRRAAS